MTSLDLGSIKQLMENPKLITDNALELLRYKIIGQKTINFENDEVARYYAELELENLGITEKVTTKYANFFNLCLNISNPGYKISDMTHLFKNKSDINYLVKVLVD